MSVALLTTTMPHSSIPDLDVFASKAAGFIGACLSFTFMKGTVPEKITMFLGGCALSYYGAQWMATRSGLPLELTSLFVGFFGMAVCSKVYDTVRMMDLESMIRGFLPKK